MSKSKGTEGIRRQAQELIDQAYDRGFKDGYDKHATDAKDAWETAEDEAYQRGLDDAWEAARKLYQFNPHNNKQLCEELFFGDNFNEVICSSNPREAIAKIKTYEEQKKAEEEEIKIGTRVRTIKDKDYLGNTLFPVGTVGVIEEIDILKRLPYKITASGGNWWYSKDMFEVIGDDEIIVGDEVYDKAFGNAVVIEISLLMSNVSLITDDGSVFTGIDVIGLQKTGRTFPQIAEVLKQLQEGE